MTHLDVEIQQLRDSMKEMMALTLSQISKARKTFLTLDKDLGREIVFYERRINSIELKIDRDCENILALLNPVAIDLRFVLACMKINTSLERIADTAEGLGNYVSEIKTPFDAELIAKIGLVEMFDVAESMLADVFKAFEMEDSSIAHGVFKKDEKLNELNIKAALVTEEFIKAHLDKTYESLFVLSAIRKMERVGDIAKNIAEEIIFYIEAKVLKHKKD
ncbi:phosphate transport system regulatory protein PhoU [Bacteroidota bacterium]|nr:phosphate transport system regulatory protein PhoU [Bacteroidota bacterium]